MTSFNTPSLWDAFGAQIRNNSRLAFEIQFRTVKRRLDVELNGKKEIYNNIDKTPSPLLAELKKEREQVEAKRKELVSYLDAMKSNTAKMNDIINNLIPKLSTAASDTGPNAEKNFNDLKGRLNSVLKSFRPAKYYDENFMDLTSNIKSLNNPSKLKDYADYLGVTDRSAAVGRVVTAPTSDQQVIVGLSAGTAMDLGHLRSKMLRDFDRANSMLGKIETKTDSKGRPVLNEKGQQVTVATSGLVKRLEDLDRRIEKVDADQRLVVLKDVQAMEKRHETILQSLSLNFEFSMANAETFADRTSFLKPQKGSIMNLFI